MSKNDDTEMRFQEALERLVAGQSKRTNGKLTQENIADEAGLDRSTLNRYPAVVKSLKEAKRRFIKDASTRGATQNKNPDLGESEAIFENDTADAKRKYCSDAVAAQQKIAILNMLLVQRDETITNLRKGEIPFFNQNIGGLTGSILGDLPAGKSTDYDTATGTTSTNTISIGHASINNIIPFKK